MKKLNVGVIGLGQRGLSLIFTILACEEANIVAVSDIVEEKRKAGVARVEEIRKTTPVAYENYEELGKRR